MFNGKSFIGSKILILGEYSAFSRNLKLGLKHFGCQVTVFTSGDGFKNIIFDDDDLYNKSTDLVVSGIRIRGSWRIQGFKNNLKKVMLDLNDWI